jgi:hypothetical protein
MECCICFELYDTRQHAPLVLQCGHTMCAACVAALPQPRMCPLDRQPEPRQLSAIPHNFALEEAAAAAQGQPKVQKAAQSAGSKANASSSSGGSGKGGTFDPSQLQASPRMLGKSSGGIASVVEGTYKGRKVTVTTCLSISTADVPAHTELALHVCTCKCKLLFYSPFAVWHLPACSLSAHKCIHLCRQAQRPVILLPCSTLVHRLPSR